MFVWLGVQASGGFKPNHTNISPYAGGLSQPSRVREKKKCPSARNISPGRLRDSHTTRHTFSRSRQRDRNEGFCLSIASLSSLRRGGESSPLPPPPPSLFAHARVFLIANKIPPPLPLPPSLCTSPPSSPPALFRSPQPLSRLLSSYPTT